MTNNRVSQSDDFNQYLWSTVKGVYHKDFFSEFLRWQLNDMIRGKKVISILSLNLKLLDENSNSTLISSEFSNLIKEQVRNTDFIFATDEQSKFYIVLLFSGSREVTIFMNRIEKAFENMISKYHTIELVEAVLEIRDGTYSMATILTELSYVENIAVMNDNKTEVKVLNKSEREHSLKVAIVDDNELTHTVLKRLMDGIKIPYSTCEVSHFKSGEDYLQSETYRSSHIQLVLISDILPERDGIEILQELRSLPNQSKYFVIVLGGRNTEEEIIYAMEQGADDYIAKPFNINLLAVKIKRLLERGI